MARAIWKGSISFGLINIPVSLFSAETRSDIQFRMIDSRNRSRVRYERVNEATGEEVPWNAIVKGYEYDDDQFVLISEEEMEKASPEATKTIELEDFIELEQVDYLYFDKPYYLEPGKGNEKSYILLAQALEKTKKAAIARVVIRTRQHLCAVLSREGRLVIDLLRFPQELRDIGDIKAPDTTAKRNQLGKREVDMATQLIDSMTVDWDPGRYHDEYRETLLEWINERIANNQIETSGEDEDEDDVSEPTKVVDLMDYLKRSVEARQSQTTKTDKKPRSKKKTSRKKTVKKTKNQAAKKAASKATTGKSSRKAS